MRHSLWTVVTLAGVLPFAHAQDFRALDDVGMVLPRGADWRDVAAGDLDGDGDRDLVFACFGVPGIGERNFWLRNDGTGLFDATPPSELQLTPSLSMCVQLADFDGDGDRDAFFGNQRFDTFCRNDGTGRLVLDGNALPPIDRETFAAAVGDVDGDGDLDIVAACGGQEILYRNNGSGGFVDGSANLPNAWNQTQDVDLGDYDGDGDLDLLLAHGDAPAQLLWNNGAGVFTASTASLPSGVWCSAGDVDGDGDRDLWIGSHTPSFPSWAQSRSLCRNDGGGSFTVQTTPVSPFPLRDGQLADVDGDGDLDLAVTGLHVLVNDGLGGFVPGPSQPALRAHFADIDGDGDPDQIGEPTLRNDGSGMFSSAPWPEVLAADQGVLFAMIDFDRDGDPDLLRGSGTVTSVLRNDGRGIFRGELAQLSGVGGSGVLWPVDDLNGDGFPDLLVPYSDQWVENLAGAGMQTRTLPAPVYRVFTIDADGDGDRDLISQSTANLVRWYRNQGGTFAAGIAAFGGASSEVRAVADLDGDGREDVLWAGSNNLLQGVRCSGNGVFTPITGMLPAGTSPAVGVAAGDFDGDGDVDLALGHDNSVGVAPRVTLLSNDGTGHLVIAATAVPYTQLDEVARIQSADFDRDGDLDLLLQTVASYGQSLLLRNDGAFVFVDGTGTGAQWLGLDLDANTNTQVADVDRDGDPDLVTAGSFFSGQLRMLRNLNSQLIMRGAPAVGANWRLEVLQRPVGSSAGGVVLGLAEPAQGLPTPFGELRIDPVGAVLHGLVVVADAAPVPVLTLPIPNTPSLRGLAVFAQHVVFDGTALRLGNQLAAVVE